MDNQIKTINLDNHTSTGVTGMAIGDYSLSTVVLIFKKKKRLQV
jgi:hypothetical protein